MIRVHFVKFELEGHGLEAAPFCQHYAPSSWHSYWNYPWWGKPEWKVEMPWFFIKGQRKMSADFTMVIGITSVLGTWQNKQLPNVLFSHNNHKRNP
jgi:hypothetical protein